MGGSQAAATGNGYRCQSEEKAPHQQRLKLIINTDAKVGVLASILLILYFVDTNECLGDGGGKRICFCQQVFFFRSTCPALQR